MVKQNCMINRSSKFPGMAISIIQNNDVLFQEGFGLRGVENNLPVNENTLFGIGSVTKSFTSAAMVREKTSQK